MALARAGRGAVGPISLRSRELGVLAMNASKSIASSMQEVFPEGYHLSLLSQVSKRLTSRCSISSGIIASVRRFLHQVVLSASHEGSVVVSTVCSMGSGRFHGWVFLESFCWFLMALSNAETRTHRYSCSFRRGKFSRPLGSIPCSLRHGGQLSEWEASSRSAGSDVQSQRMWWVRFVCGELHISHR